jgi:antirestriction protein ArdC
MNSNFYESVTDRICRGWSRGATMDAAVGRRARGRTHHPAFAGERRCLSGINVLVLWGVAITKG